MNWNTSNTWLGAQPSRREAIRVVKNSACTSLLSHESIMNVLALWSHKSHFWYWLGMPPNTTTLAFSNPTLIRSNLHWSFSLPLYWRNLILRSACCIVINTDLDVSSVVLTERTEALLALHKSFTENRFSSCLKWAHWQAAGDRYYAFRTDGCPVAVCCRIGVVRKRHSCTTNSIKLGSVDIWLIKQYHSKERVWKRCEGGASVEPSNRSLKTWLIAAESFVLSSFQIHLRL